MISAGTSITLGIFGFGAIWFTATANRRNSIKAEADKQRLEIYREALSAIETASAAQRKAVSFVQSTLSAIHLRQTFSAAGQQPALLTQRYDEFMTLHRAVGHGTSQLMMFLERWAIVDRRLKMFRLGFHLRSTRALQLMSELSALYRDMLPFEAPGGRTISSNSAFLDEQVTRLKTATDQYAYELSLLDAYFGDLNVELQGLLLSHLFGKQPLERRDPPDPNQFTLRLDRYDDVMTKLQREPEFAEYEKRDRELRAFHGTVRPGSLR